MASGEWREGEYRRPTADGDVDESLTDWQQSFHSVALTIRLATELVDCESCREGERTTWGEERGRKVALIN